MGIHGDVGGRKGNGGEWYILIKKEQNMIINMNEYEGHSGELNERKNIKKLFIFMMPLIQNFQLDNSVVEMR